MSDNQHTHEHRPLGGVIGGSSECLLCPVCVLLQALSSTRPAVTEHLLAAARELALALGALMDSPQDARQATPRVERIDVDER